jgi:hypothetical protein
VRWKSLFLDSFWFDVRIGGKYYTAKFWINDGRIPMAVKRDYGSFAKASARLLAPQVEPLGYRPWYGGGFGREKSGWVEGFFLQQSQWGSGDFCVTLGIHVPDHEEIWALDRVNRVFGLLIAWRLSDVGTEHGGDRWYHAKNKEQLQNNMSLVAASLAKADSWFQQFSSFSDVVEQYRVRSGLPRVPMGELRFVCVLNYGILLFLDNAKQEAASWLRFAGDLHARPKYWDAKARTFSHEQAPGLKLMKPTKDDELYRRVIESTLAKLES